MDDIQLIAGAVTTAEQVLYVCKNFFTYVIVAFLNIIHYKISKDLSMDSWLR